MKYSSLFSKAACFLSVFLLIFSSLSFTAFADTTLDEDRDKYKDLEQTLNEIKNSQDSIADSIKDAKENKDSAIELKNLLDSEIALIEKEIETIALLTEEYKKRIASLEEQISRLEETMYASYRKFIDRLVAIYEQGDSEYIDFILKAEDLTEMMSRIEYTSELVDFERDILNKLSKDHNDLQLKKEERRIATERITEMLNISKEKENELRDRSQYAQSLIAAYENDIIKFEQLERESEQDAADIEAMLKELAAQIKDKEALLYAGGKMSWVLDKDYYITSDRGYRIHPVTGEKQSYHKGIDIGTNYTKAPVYAAGDGKVIWASVRSTYGNCVMIDHGYDEEGRNIVTLYAHLSKISVKSGQKVKAGDIIGKVGDTGRANGIHLHLEVRVDGVDVDPREYIDIKAKKR